MVAWLPQAVALAWRCAAGTASLVWLLWACSVFVQGAGIGVAMPAVTSAVMDVLPLEHAGAGSALDEHRPPGRGRRSAWACSARILAESDDESLSADLAVLPATARSAVGGSIAATQAACRSARRGLLVPAGACERCVMSAMHVTMFVARSHRRWLGAIVVLRWAAGALIYRAKKE